MNNESPQKRILFVDNDTSWLDFATKTLKQVGYYIQRVDNIGTGLELLTKSDFELILADIRGIEEENEAFQNMVQHQLQRGNRIVALSPTALSAERTGRIYKLGAQDCIDKQHDRQGLIRMVQSQLPKDPIQNPEIILIIEDDMDWRDRLEYYLKDEPYLIESASDFSSAVQRLKKSNFDIVVLDLRLVEESEEFEGMELLRILRKDGADVPVVMISAYGTTEHVKESFQKYNISDYFSKQTFDPRRYRRAIQEAVSRGK